MGQQGFAVSQRHRKIIQKEPPTDYLTSALCHHYWYSLDQCHRYVQCGPHSVYAVHNCIKTDHWYNTFWLPCHSHTSTASSHSHTGMLTRCLGSPHLGTYPWLHLNITTSSERAQYDRYTSSALCKCELMTCYVQTRLRH